jgi:mono/diheme cytochrome c family protein
MMTMMRTIIAAAVLAALHIDHAAAQDPAMIEAGGQVYEEHCAACHGEKLRSAGAMPDLREFGDDRARFDKAVLEGRGQMPSWQGILSAEQLDQLWAYIRRYAR